MASSSIAFEFEIEPIVKVRCLNDKCDHNLEYAGYACCNLKRIVLDEHGVCYARVSQKTMKDARDRDRLTEAS